MSQKVIYNIIILAVIWVAVVGAGFYVTSMKQPEELERVIKAEKVERLKQSELTSLLAEQTTARNMANEAVRKWAARYKVFPDSLSGPEVIGYFNELTKQGFENFDVQYQGVQSTQDYKFHQFQVEGRGYFTDLYRVIWELENNRYFYDISELNLDHIDLITEDEETGNDRMKVMVSFRFQTNAYFGGAEGMSAPLAEDTGIGEADALPVGRAKSDMPPVPKHVLPKERPTVNPFFPLIMNQIPPNTHGLIDLENAQLASIVGKEAYFREGEKLRSVGVGGDVYLGQITAIDPIEGRVTARLNKGGIIDEIDLYLQSGEKSGKSLGTIRRAPGR